MEKRIHPWSVPVAVEDVPETGLHMEIEAPPAVRTELARLAGLRELPRLAAVFDLIRQGAGVHVSGRVMATLGQTCVVSLEPMESTLDEGVDVTFSPSIAAQAVTAAEGHHAKPDDEEPPEPLIGGAVDVGALATEFLLLGIDPYPRKPGVRFAPPKVEDGGEHPFAALEGLKKRLGGGQS
jgi:Large ribosomal RNA subunit accumulation protein YceD